VERGGLELPSKRRSNVIYVEPGRSGGMAGRICYTVACSAILDCGMLNSCSLLLLLCSSLSLRTLLIQRLQVYEGVGNDRSQLSPWMEKAAEVHDSRVSMESLKLRNIAKVARFMKQPAQQALDMDQTRLQLYQDIQTMTFALSSMSPLDKHKETMHCHGQIGLCLLLSFGIICVALLCQITPDNSALALEVSSLIDQVITLGREASRYRPVGARAIPYCLAVAWAATTDFAQQTHLETLIAEYQADAPGMSWLEVAASYRSKWNPNI
jgi:hypothetical protein